MERFPLVLISDEQLFLQCSEFHPLEITHRWLAVCRPKIIDSPLAVSEDSSETLQLGHFSKLVHIYQVIYYK